MNPTADILQRERRRILADAGEAARRAPHYAASPETAGRIETLFELLLAAVDRQDLSRILEYARRIAGERYAAGYDLGEVQVAVNALEEAAWRRIAATRDPDELGESLRLISTVLGAAKDALARTYVSLAARAGEPVVDVSALFAGTN
jgi:hypothetical protein